MKTIKTKPIVSRFLFDGKILRGTQNTAVDRTQRQNTAVEKVDWLVSKVLTQLIEHVPANVKNSEEVLNKLKTLKESDLSSNKTFISLDVINLYPSIKIVYGIEAVMELAQKHWQEIDNWSLTIEDLKKCLNFICYN